MLQQTREHRLFESLRSDQEDKIMNELTFIDQRLKTRKDSNVKHEEYKDVQRQNIYSKNYLSKWFFYEKGQIQTHENPPMDYFSQIGNQQVEDDSLFDPQNNFLAASKPNHSQEQSLYTQQARCRPKKQWSESFRDNECSQRNLESGEIRIGRSQIQKEWNYVYRKQSKVGVKVVENMGIGCKKVNKSRQKNMQNENKLAKIYLNENEKEYPSSLKENSQNKYLIHPLIEQERQSFQTDSSIKFTTFSIQNNSSQPNFNQHKQDDIHKSSLQCTFKPNILKKSSQMVKNSKNVVQRLSTSGQNKIKQKTPYQKPIFKPSINKNRIDELSQPRKLKTQISQLNQQRPSFRPSLSKKSLQQMSNCTYDVATRNQLWLQQRQEKIQRLRQEQEKIREKRQDCTYSPVLCLYKGEINNPQLSRFGKEGIMNYFGRVSSKLSKSKTREGKENTQSSTNMLSSKENFGSKGNRKQRYNQAVKELHSRIMNLKI